MVKLTFAVGYPIGLFARYYLIFLGDSDRMSLWVCPVCGKQNSILHYDPTNFVDDIMIILLRGLGKGRGFEEVERYSLLDGSDPDLLELISDRVAVLYDLLYEDIEDDEAEIDLEDDEDEPSTELEKELRISEMEEEEDINDLDEEKIE